MATYGGKTPEDLVVQAVGPEDLATADNAGTYVSLADYDRAEVHIFTGDVAGNTSAVTLLQATALAGTGEKSLEFTKYYRPGQKLLITGQSGTFSVGETITGGTSNNTAKVMKISAHHLWVAILTQTTTWTDGETISGGTSSASATVSGTGQDEDVPLEETASGNTFNTLAITFKHWMIPVTADMLDRDNDFDCFRVNLAQAGGSTIASAHYRLMDGRIKKYPQQSAIGTLKVV